MESFISLFAGDTSLSTVVGTQTVSGRYSTVRIEKISNWADRWLDKLKPSQSKSLLISRKRIKLDPLVITIPNIVEFRQTSFINTSVFVYLVMNPGTTKHNLLLRWHGTKRIGVLHRL